MKAAKKADILKEMDHGVNLMESGQYTQADIQFRNVLENAEVVPTDLTFHIGKNSLYLEQFKQSINWLNKYIELKGTKGQYYFEAVQLLKDAEKGFLSAERTATDSLQSDTTALQVFKECQEGTNVICPVCKGETVIIETSNFGTKYRPCPYSNDKGLLTCVEYNLLLQGKLVPKF
ncbi:MAG: hypothetical protein OEX02_01245 [Cyclobacteriaceae bacterium]|nr:hypothetical protein [Cyclobacteriaceae bacterium]